VGLRQRFDIFLGDGNPATGIKHHDLSSVKGSAKKKGANAKPAWGRHADHVLHRKVLGSVLKNAIPELRSDRSWNESLVRRG
jgi:hypothetical protein